MPIPITLIGMSSLTFCLHDPWVSTSQFAKHNALARACNIKFHASAFHCSHLSSTLLFLGCSQPKFSWLCACACITDSTVEIFGDTYSKRNKWSIDMMQILCIFDQRNFWKKKPVKKLNRSWKKAKTWIFHVPRGKCRACTLAWHSFLLWSNSPTPISGGN